MSTRLRGEHLIQLRSELDRILQFRHWDANMNTWVDDDEPSASNGTGIGMRIAKVGAVGSAGIGGYYGGKALGRAFPNQAGILRKEAGALYSDAKTIAGKGVSAAKSALPGVKAGVKKAGTSVASLLAKLKNVRFEARGPILIELSENIHQFKLRLSESEFKDRFGMTPDELNRKTKTGPYEDPSKRKARRIAGAAAIAGGTSILAHQGYGIAKSVGKTASQIPRVRQAMDTAADRITAQRGITSVPFMPRHPIKTGRAVLERANATKRIVTAGVKAYRHG